MAASQRRSRLSFRHDAARPQDGRLVTYMQPKPHGGPPPSGSPTTRLGSLDVVAVADGSAPPTSSDPVSCSLRVEENPTS